MRTSRIAKDEKVFLKASKESIILSDDGKRLLKVCKSYTSEVTISEGTEIICDDAFRGNTTVEKVILPSTLQVIGKHAFDGCVNLKYVFIPEGVTEIPNSCFKSCTSLSQVVLPDSLITIGDNAFEDCTSLRTLSFPSHLRSVYDYAFMHSGLETFNPSIAKGSRCHIFDKAFAFCENLKTVTLNHGIHAGFMCFLRCANLEEVTFADEHHGRPGAVATMLIGCDNLKKIIVPAYSKYNFNSKGWDIGEYVHCDFNHLVVME